MENHIQSFTGLQAWKEAHKFVLMIYKITNEFPKSEIFGLTSQIRRAAVSISSNIAEGFSRKSPNEKIQFYHIALGSLTETQNQLLIGRDVTYIPLSAFGTAASQSTTVSKLINGLIKSQKQRILTP